MVSAGETIGVMLPSGPCHVRVVAAPSGRRITVALPGGVDARAVWGGSVWIVEHAPTKQRGRQEVSANRKGARR